MKTFTLDELKNLKPGDLDISETGLKAGVLGEVWLVYTQAYLLQWAQSVKAEGLDSVAFRAMQSVQEAIDILADDMELSDD